MAINKKLIHFKSKQKFEEELANGNILDTSIVFIQETTEIYTHGQFYNGSTFDSSDIETSIQNILDNYATKDELPTKVSELENDSNYLTSIPNADTDLGLVKSGGDVTITDGIITVNDDSHNHVINNIDGLQDALNAKADKTTTVNGYALSNNVTLNYEDVGADVEGAAAQALVDAKAYADGKDSAMDARVKVLEDIDHDQLAADAASSAVATILDGAPEKFDTLKEVADWIASSESADSAADLVTRVSALEAINHEAYKAADIVLETSLKGYVDGKVDGKFDAEGSAAQALIDANDYTDTEIKSLSDDLTESITQLDNTKVDKVEGKGLSTNDYTTEEKNKLAGIAAGATANLGTITEIRMNGASKGNEGVVDLGIVLTEHQDISGKLDADVANTTYITKTDAAITYQPKGEYASKQEILEEISELNAVLVDTEEEADDPIVNGGGTLDPDLLNNYALKSDSIKNITRNGNTFTATKADGNTFTFTQTDTTYSANNGITLNGTTFGLTSGIVTAGSKGPNSAVTGNNNTTVAIPRITVDTYGRVTGLTSYNLTCKNTTYNAATTSANGLMSSTDKSRLDFMHSSSAVTTLASLPAKAVVTATLSGATAISLASALTVGQSITVICTPTVSFTQPIPTSGSFISMDGDSLLVTSGKVFEINILCYASGKYSISCKTAA